MVEEQLELSLHNPYTLRLPIKQALDLFHDLDWKFTAKSRTTKKCFERLKEFFQIHGIHYCDEISRSTVEAMRRWLKGEGLADATINTHHMLLTRMFNVLYDLKENKADYATITLPSRNPGSLVPKAPERRYAAPDGYPEPVIRKLIKSAIQLGYLGWAEKIEFRWITPMRPCDFFSMTHQNVNLPMQIVSGIQKKTANRRHAGVPYLYPLTKRTSRILERRMERIPPGQPLWNKSGQQKKWKKICTHAGFTGVRFDKIRHSALTQLGHLGTNSRTIQDMGGWTSERMIPTYVKKDLSAQRQAAKNLETSTEKKTLDS